MNICLIDSFSINVTKLTKEDINSFDIIYIFGHDDYLLNYFHDTKVYFIKATYSTIDSLFSGIIGFHSGVCSMKKELEGFTQELNFMIYSLQKNIKKVFKSSKMFNVSLKRIDPNSNKAKRIIRTNQISSYERIVKILNSEYEKTKELFNNKKTFINYFHYQYNISCEYLNNCYDYMNTLCLSDLTDFMEKNNINKKVKNLETFINKWR